MKPVSQVSIKQIEGYEEAARNLTDEQLQQVLDCNITMARKFPNWPGRDERRKILYNEIVRRRTKEEPRQ